ncbi:MAG: hypothetical protein D4S01_05135 [Dehalococcoidia bacterium]|nr:MAG: hypothetical protein D4S01_05135 [Dehalococcoidia bacterium]
MQEDPQLMYRVHQRVSGATIHELNQYLYIYKEGVSLYNNKPQERLLRVINAAEKVLRRYIFDGHLPKGSTTDGILEADPEASLRLPPSDIPKFKR